MAGKLAQKKFKFEFEFTVELDELEEEHLCNCEPVEQLESLKRLQRALVDDRAALAEQMMAKALGKLQEYVDYLACQDNLTSLEGVAGKLDLNDQDFFLEKPDEFADLTRPLRSAALSARMERSSLQEQVEDQDGAQEWQPVWADLFREDGLGKELRRFSVPQSALPEAGSSKIGHYLLARYLTRQADGVHFETRCACGKLFMAVAADEDAALEIAWTAFKRHHDLASIGQKMRRGWTEMKKKRYGES